MYNLHRSVPYEGDYIAVTGNLDEIKEWIRDNPSVCADDLYITQEADVCIEDVVTEARS